jgi:hypothetical protein
MKIKPVFNKESQLFVWEINDINLPNDIDEQLSNIEWNPYYTDNDGHPVGRYIGNDICIGNYTDTALLEIKNHLVNDIFYENIHQAWPGGYLKNYDMSNQSHSIIKDISNTDMGEHWDNFLVYGVFIFNLKDNPEARTTYYDFKSEKLIYQGPTKKGSGVFHLNSAACLHNGYNRGNEDRIISMTVLDVKN